MDKSASQILMEAKALVATPDKWWTGWPKHQTGNTLCVGQAICLRSHDSHLAFSYFYRAIGAIQPAIRSHTPIFDWNDYPTRTHAEVMQAFDRAIALAEKDEGRKPREDDATYAARMVREIVNATPVAVAVVKA